jgi:hypothetical protein
MTVLAESIAGNKISEIEERLRSLTFWPMTAVHYEAAGRKKKTVLILAVSPDGSEVTCCFPHDPGDELPGRMSYGLRAASDEEIALLVADFNRDCEERR